MEKFLSEGTAVNVMESEADEWDPAAKGKTYLITSYEVQNPKKELKGGARATADVTVYIESEDKKEHMAISLRDLFRWNSIE